MTKSDWMGATANVRAYHISVRLAVGEEKLKWKHLELPESPVTSTPEDSSANYGGKKFLLQWDEPDRPKSYDTNME